MIVDLQDICAQTRYVISANETVIGKAKVDASAGVATFVIPRTTISRRHANLEFDGNFWLIDNGSVNGSWLNGQKVSQRVVLHHGDHLRFDEFV